MDPARIDSDHQYAAWEELEKLLRDRFKSMRVTCLELGASEAKVVLEGIDGQSLTTLAGTRIPGVWKYRLAKFLPKSTR